MGDIHPASITERSDARKDIFDRYDIDPWPYTAWGEPHKRLLYCSGIITVPQPVVKGFIDSSQRKKRCRRYGRQRNNVPLHTEASYIVCLRFSRDRHRRSCQPAATTYMFTRFRVISLRFHYFSAETKCAINVYPGSTSTPAAAAVFSVKQVTPLFFSALLS